MTNPPTQPLIAAIRAKNNNANSGKANSNALTEIVPTTFAIAAAPMQQAAQQALCLDSKKKPSIANPGAR